MLFDESHQLEQYVKRKQDKHLYKWWAQYLESLNELTAASQYYQLAGDYLSLVRIACFQGQYDEVRIHNSPVSTAPCSGGTNSQLEQQQSRLLSSGSDIRE